MKPALAVAAAIATLSIAATAQTPAAPVAPAAVTTPIVGAGGKQLGTLSLTPAPTGVLITVAATGLTPGWHAMHFHAVGDCSDEGFKKSGAHINHATTKSPHGLLNPQGPDFGDLPNIYAQADGSVNAQAFTSLVRMGGSGTQPDLTDADGSALVIHANADDHISQPIGGAGDRVGCAVIKG
ncbi:MAG: superoxide dismutase [Sphingomonas sp.]|nr:MAG: superoxide dismutase [Sphingomonas sp.]